MPTISIIIPVYNTGEILHNTINSVLNQTYKDFELLLIDDGSKDCSGRICDEYALKDTRIRIFHKKNGGISNARNYGIERSLGEYITFCDHDDLYNPTFLENMIKYAKTTNSDIIKCGINVEYTKHNKHLIRKYCEHIITYKQEELSVQFLDLLSNDILEPIWNAIYKAKVLKEARIKFNEEFKYGGEDFDFNIRLYEQISSISIIPEILYTHFIRPSLSTSAKLYNDILSNFITETYKINYYVEKNQLLNISEQNNKYLYAYMKRVISFMSYAAKMKKKHFEIKNGIDELQNNCLIKGEFISIKYLLNRKKIKERLFYILFYILKLKQLHKLYPLFKCLK